MLQSIHSSNSLKKLESLRYSLLPGRFAPGFEGTSLYNKAFQYWVAFWNKVLADNGSHEPIEPYDFLRSDLVAVLTSNDEVVAVHLYSLFNIEQTSLEYHPYLRGKEERAFLASLKDLNCRSAVSFEFLTLNDQWRKSKIGFSLAPVIVGLGYKIQKALNIDAALGRCRKDLHVNQLMTQVGGITLKTDVMMHNTPTDFCAVLLSQMKDHPDKDVQELIGALWSKRTDFSNLTIIKSIPLHETAA